VYNKELATMHSSVNIDRAVMFRMSSGAGNVDMTKRRQKRRKDIIRKTHEGKCHLEDVNIDEDNIILDLQ
jgi:hypothetical protein